MSETAAETPRVTAVRSSPERVVLSEDGNRHGWLSSDTSVELDVLR